MIVKNEAHVIRETLESIISFIDYWVISDTGSSDDTCETIERFFQEKNIPGEMYHDEWKDFGYNRTLVFQHAFGKSDYVWVMDADDLVVGDLRLPEPLDADGYSLNLGSYELSYRRPLIFRNDLRWRSIGVLHEFAVCVSKPVQFTVISGDYYIESRRLGDRNKNPVKYLRDAQLLEGALATEKDENLYWRYLYYTGQSYMDFGDYKRALYYYQQRMKGPETVAEIYDSCLRAASCLERIDKKKHQKKIKEYLARACGLNPRRVEAFYHLARFLIQEKEYDKAFNLMGCAVLLPFTEKDHAVMQKSLYLYDAKLMHIELCRVVGNPKQEYATWKALLQENGVEKLWPRVDIRRYPEAIRLLSTGGRSLPITEGETGVGDADKHPLSLAVICDDKDDQPLRSFCYCEKTPFFIPEKAPKMEDLRIGSRFLLHLPPGWLFITPGRLLEKVVAKFHEEPGYSRVYFNPANIETGVIPPDDRNVESGPFVEDTRTRNGGWAHLSAIHCTRIPTTSCETMWNRENMKNRCFHYGLTPDSDLLQEFLSSLFVFGLALENNFSFCFSTVPYRNAQNILLKDWDSSGEWITSHPVAHFSVGEYRLHWLKDRVACFREYRRFLEETENNPLRTVVCADSLSLDENNPDYALRLFIHLSFNIPLEASIYATGKALLLPYHKHIPVNLLTDRHLMPRIYTHSFDPTNQVLHHIHPIQIVQEDSIPLEASFLLLLRELFCLSLPVLSWLPVFLSVIYNLRELDSWSGIDLRVEEGDDLERCEWCEGDSSSPFFLINRANTGFVDGPCYRFPLFTQPLKAPSRKKHEDLFLPHLNFVNSEVFYNPDLSVSRDLIYDARNNLGFLKTFLTNSQYFVYEKEYPGDFLSSDHLPLEGYVAELGDLDWSGVKMDVPPFPKTKLPIYCVNLLRRPDRKQRLLKQLTAGKSENLVRFVEAVDWQTLTQCMPQKDLLNLFLGSNCGHRPGMMACALSHLKLWEALARDENHSYYFIIEDDVDFDVEPPFQRDTEGNFFMIDTMVKQLTSWDILMLGYSRWNDETPRRSEVLGIQKLSPEYIGGTFGYAIHKKTAIFLVEMIRRTGFTTPVDNFWVRFGTDRSFFSLFQLTSDFVRTPWCRPDDQSGRIDTDIQKVTQCFVFHNPSDFIIFRGATIEKNRETRDWPFSTYFFGVVSHAEKFIGFTQNHLLHGAGVQDLVPAPNHMTFLMRRKVLQDQSKTMKWNERIITADALFKAENCSMDDLKEIVQRQSLAIGFTKDGVILREGEGGNWRAVVPNNR